MICAIKKLKAEVGDQVLFDVLKVELNGPGCVIYGSSGVGKSTFLRALANGEAEYSFDAVKFQKNLNFHSAIKTIRYIPQHPPRFELTVNHFFERMLKANSHYDGCRKTLECIIAEFAIQPILESKMSDISGGQLHRVHLASALSSSADLLLLDEPSAALDDVNRKILIHLLTEYMKKQQGFVICCTHDVNFRLLAAQDSHWHAVAFPSLLPLEEEK